MKAFLLLCACAVMAASDSISWSYRPFVGYEGESLVATWPASDADGWRVVDGNGHSLTASMTFRDGQGTIQLEAHGLDRVQLIHGNVAGPGLRLVRAGAAAGLSADRDGFPCIDGMAAVLVLDRIEARADRRWLMLREEIDASPVHCAHVLAAPAVPVGQPALIAQCIASQTVDPSGGVLVELSGLDRLAAWKHREYRQVLAWLVSDLQFRNAGHVALAQPVAAAPHLNDLRPFQAQVRDVALAYRCRILDTQNLSLPAYWLDGSGLLGTQFNAEGAAQWQSLIAPWRAAAQ